MISYDQALASILGQVTPLPPVRLPLDRAGGLVLAAAPAARRDLPGADTSAMDGYAFAWAGQESGARLAVAGCVAAGEAPGVAPAPGGAVRIMTGAPLPSGCDTVIPFEDVAAAAEAIVLRRRPRQGQHVRRRGEELEAGALPVAAGTVLRSGEIGLLAAAGIPEVEVIPAPRVALLATGDELVALGEAPRPGQAVNSNLHMLAARLREEGYPALPLGIAGDRRETLRQELGRGFDADLLLTIGGASVGDRDFVRETLVELGFTVHFWKAAIKPGKPVLFASRKGLPVLGLPGNPAAAAATFEIFARPALRRLAGDPQPLPPRLRATVTAAVTGGDRLRFVWGEARCREGELHFTPAVHQQSGRTTCLRGFNALLPVAAGGGLAAGDRREILLLRLPAGVS